MATFNEPSKGDGPPSGAGDVLVRVKQEEDSKIEVAARLGLPSAFAERHSHLSGGDGTSGTSGRSSSNSAMTSSPHSTPPPVDVKPQLTVSAVPLVLANQSITRTQNLSPGLSERQPNNQDNKRINNNTASYQSGGRLKFFKGKDRKYLRAASKKKCDFFFILRNELLILFSLFFIFFGKLRPNSGIIRFLIKMHAVYDLQN